MTKEEYEITVTDFINLSNVDFGNGPLKLGKANFKLAKEYAEQYKNQQLKALLLFLKVQNLQPVYSNWKQAYTGEFFTDDEILIKFENEK